MCKVDLRSLVKTGERLGKALLDVQSSLEVLITDASAQVVSINASGRFWAEIGRLADVKIYFLVLELSYHEDSVLTIREYTRLEEDAAIPITDSIVHKARKISAVEACESGKLALVLLAGIPLALERINRQMLLVLNGAEQTLETINGE